MLKKIYDKCLDWAGHRFANSILAIVSFLESFIFPIPTDTMIIPMVIAKKNEFIKISLIAIIFSVLGALVGYLIGYIFFNELGVKIFEFLDQKMQIYSRKSLLQKMVFFLEH